MAALIYVLLLVTSSGVMSLLLQHVDEEWSMFKFKFSRKYSSVEEDAYRYSVFTENLQKILQHNMAADKGNFSYWLGINNFADLTEEEFQEQFAGLKITPRAKPVHAKHTSYNLTALPKGVDWRMKQCVTPVKNQGKCGSSYAFAATGALESHHCIKTGKLVSLSEQNILDCTYNNSFMNEGCIGGDPNNAFVYVIDNGGIDTEKAYPYNAKVGNCKFRKENIGATEKKIYNIPSGNEHALQEAVAWRGPVSVCLDIRGFQFYRHGLYDYVIKTDLSTSRSNLLTHAMVVVGYDTTSDGEDYWVLKNSWGTSWGLSGYMKLARNNHNSCGIASYASYPVV